MNRWLLPVLIAVLALASGVLHLALNFILFRGDLIGSGSPSGPPSGSAIQLPLPLNLLFTLNFIGYVVLVGVFLSGERWLGRWRWLVDVALIVYTAASLVLWLAYGSPGGRGLALPTKVIEIVLIIALVAHLWMVLRKTGTDVQAA